MASTCRNRLPSIETCAVQPFPHHLQRWIAASPKGCRAANSSLMPALISMAMDLKWHA